MKKTKSFIDEFDYQILVIFIILALVGLLLQLDISQERALKMFYKQSIWALLSLFSMMFVLLYIKMDFVRKYIKVFLGITILLLIYVLVNPHVVNGAHRGIKIGPVNFQPSLLARIVLIIYVADVLDRKKLNNDRMSFIDFIKEYKVMLSVIALVYVLVLMEKHLSILIILSLVLLSMFWITGIRTKILAIFLGSVLLVALLGFTFLSSSGTSYRGRRIKIYTNYSLIARALGIKPQKINGDEQMQIRESLIALSSGKLLGLGMGKSIAKNYYLAESRTDYIYGIIGEEYGFIGAFLIMIIYGWLFIRIFKLHNRLKDDFLKLSALGLGLNLFYNAMVNIGVNISALPSTGVTLPFISYGGTSFLINAVALGLILSMSVEWNKR